jgi:hypothetical protein
LSGAISAIQLLASSFGKTLEQAQEKSRDKDLPRLFS